MKVCSRCKVGKDESEFRVRVEKRQKTFRRNPLTYLNNTCRDCDRILTHERYLRIKDDPRVKKLHAQHTRGFYKRNRQKCLDAQKKRRDSEKGREIRRKYDAENKDKIKAQHSAVAKKWAQYQKVNLTDAYCIQLLMTQTGLHRRKITIEMVEQKRLQLKLKRKLYEISKEIDTRGNHGRPNSLLSGADLHQGNRSSNA